MTNDAREELIMWDPTHDKPAGKLGHASLNKGMLARKWDPLPFPIIEGKGFKKKRKRGPVGPMGSGQTLWSFRVL